MPESKKPASGSLLEPGHCAAVRSLSAILQSKSLGNMAMTLARSTSIYCGLARYNKAVDTYRHGSN